MLVPSSPFTFLIGSPTEPGAHSPLVASTGGTVCIAVHGFYVGAGDMNISTGLGGKSLPQPLTNFETGFCVAKVNLTGFLRGCP